MGKKRKRKEVTRTDLMNLWLQKYHNTNCDEVVEKYPELVKSPDWFKLFPCTKEQDEEWVVEAKKLLVESGIPKSIVDHDWPFIYLNNSPYVPHENLD